MVVQRRDGPRRLRDNDDQYLFVKASKMTVTKVSVQDQQGSESVHSDQTKPKYDDDDN